MTKPTEERPPGPSIESPTWGQVQHMAVTVIKLLGGPKATADQLSWESFYTLTILASLRLDEDKAQAPLLGRRWLS